MFIFDNQVVSTSALFFVYGSVSTSAAAYRPGEIIEEVALIADGTEVTVGSGTYSLSNVTSATDPFPTTLTDIPGSSIDYTPPSGTSVVQYQFYYQVGYSSSQPRLHQRFYVDGVEVTDAKKGYAAEYFEGNIAFNVDGNFVESDAEGKLLSSKKSYSG